LTPFRNGFLGSRWYAMERYARSLNLSPSVLNSQSSTAATVSVGGAREGRRGWREERVVRVERRLEEKEREEEREGGRRR
jgi:hypothetical protein